MLRLVVVICIVVAAALAVLFVVDWSSAFISCLSDYHGAKNPQENTANDCDTIGIVHAGFDWILERGADWWTAFAGLAVAIFTYTLWQSSEKMWAVTKVAADAAKESADALKSAERAQIWMNEVRLEGFKADATETTDLRLKWEIKNSGRTAGTIHRFKHRCTIAKKLPELPDYGDQDPVDFRLFVPPDKVIRHAGDTVIFKVIPDAIRRIVAKETTLFIYGYVVYVDIFGDTYQSGFAYWLELSDQGSNCWIAGVSRYWDHKKIDG